MQAYPLLHYFLRPTKGQVVCSLFGSVAYFLYVYLSVNFFMLKPEKPSLYIYTVELVATLIACNLVVIVNRYIGDRFDQEHFSQNLLNVRSYFMKLALQILSSIVICNIVFALEGWLTDEHSFWMDLFTTNVLTVPFAVIYYTIENANSLIKHYKSQSVKLESVKKERLDTELQLLRAQFNPHFIFNAINTIYFQIDEGSDKSQLILPRFRNMLSYLTYWCNHKLVPLDKELEYLQNFTEIQMIRKGEDIDQRYSVSADRDDYLISPFLLQPFVENAFKYISGEMQMHIKLTVNQGKLSYTVINSVDPLYSSIEPSSKGVGLKNLKKRVALIYPDKNYMSTRMKENRFVAEMQLKIEHP